MANGSSPPPRPRRPRLAAWLDDRVGFSLAAQLLFEEAIPGGARWSYVLGTTAAMLFVLEAVTGILLAAHYAPTTAGAWASTAFIQDSLSAGWFIRGLHGFGSSALIAVTLLHLLQVIWAGAYRAPRELNWLVGLGLFGLVGLFALSGHGLPWDEKGYWSKQIEAGIVGGLPLVGGLLRRLLQGGSSFGNYTLTHFFTLHAIVLPALMGVGLAVHLWMVRRHGHAPPAGLSEAELARTAQPYVPDQAARDGVATAVIVVSLCLVTVATGGPALEGPADPNASYQARPEWYGLPLFALRRLLPTALESLGTIVLPGVLATLLAALPWIDRAKSRRPRERWPLLAAAGAGFLVLGFLTLLPLLGDARDPAYQRARAEAGERAQRARTLAKKGVPVEGGLAVYRNDPSWRPRELWRERCASCHSFSGNGGKGGPDFKGYGTRAWIRGFLRDPNGPLYMGPAKIERGMKPVEASPAELEALTELVYAETGASDADPVLIARAGPLWSEKDCDACHERDGATENTGPNLKGRGRRAWIESMIADASHPLLFGSRNKMPRFSEKLSPEEISELAAFVQREAQQQEAQQQETTR